MTVVAPALIGNKKTQIGEVFYELGIIVLIDGLQYILSAIRIQNNIINVGKIPFLGEVIFVGLYPIYFVGAVFVLYTTVVLAVLILYLPAVLALWEEDAMGSAFQAYAITWNQTWRAAVYSALTGALAVVGAMLYGWVITAGYHFINWVFGSSWLMGSKLGPILAWAEQIVFSGYSHLFTYIPGQFAPLSPLTADVNLAYVSGWEAFIGSVLAILLLLIYGSVVAYGLSIISVGQSLSFLIYKLKTDDENLLERKDSILFGHVV